MGCRRITNTLRPVVWVWEFVLNFDMKWKTTWETEIRFHCVSAFDSVIVKSSQALFGFVYLRKCLQLLGLILCDKKAN